MIRATLMAATATNAVMMYADHHPWGAALSVLCVLVMAIRFRLGAVLTAIVMMIWLKAAHEFLILSLALIAAFFPSPRQMVFLVRVQITALYVYCAIAKFRPAFRSGEVLQRGELLLVDHLPISVLVWGTIAAELAIIPILMWIRPKWAFWVGLAFQISILIGMIPYRSAYGFNAELSFLAGLLTFAILLIGCLWLNANADDDESDHASGAATAVPLI